MRISKHLHSCLLVEEENTTILIDPGNFTVTAKALDLSKIAKLDYLLITHEHQDHLAIPLIKDLLERFHDLKIISNPEVVSLLKQERIVASADETPVVQFEVLTHERLWDKEPPQNSVFTIFNKLTHPGDSLHFSKTADILALPITAPWGSTTQAVEKALLMKPKFILPIHDWMWKDEVRIAMYQRLAEFFKTHGITFVPLETGQLIQI